MEPTTHPLEEWKPGVGGAANGATTPDFTIVKCCSHEGQSWYAVVISNGTMRWERSSGISIGARLHHRRIHPDRHRRRRHSLLHHLRHHHNLHPAAFPLWVWPHSQSRHDHRVVPRSKPLWLDLHHRSSRQTRSPAAFPFLGP